MGKSSPAQLAGPPVLAPSTPPGHLPGLESSFEYRNDSNSRRSELFQVTQEIPILTRLVVHLHQTPRSLPYTGNTHGSHLGRGTKHAINSQVTEKEEKTRKNERRARTGSSWNHGNFLSTEHYPKHSLKLQLTSLLNFLFGTVSGDISSILLIASRC